MLIPNAESAVIDIRQLRDYCLNLEHDEGKHKALLFSTVFGMTAKDAGKLRQILLEVVKTHEAKLGDKMNLDSAILWISSLNGKTKGESCVVAR